MRTKEKYMNNQYAQLCTEYQEVKKVLETLEAKASKTNEGVAKLTNELAEVSEKLDDMKESLESKDSGINDTSPLVRMKAALQQIKAEACAFDLRIGVVSHSLLAARIGATQRRRMKVAQKAKQRHNKNKKGKEDAGGDDNSLASGDEE
jgi:estrogen-related receptor beta like 1